MAAEEGFRRLNRFSLLLACCGPLGLVIWLIQFFTIGRWGLVQLLVLALVPVFFDGTA